MIDDTQGRASGESVESLPQQPASDAESGEVKGGAVNAFVPTDQYRCPSDNGLLKPAPGGAVLDPSKTAFKFF